MLTVLVGAAESVAALRIPLGEGALAQLLQGLSLCLDAEDSQEAGRAALRSVTFRAEWDAAPDALLLCSLLTRQSNMAPAGPPR